MHVIVQAHFSNTDRHVGLLLESFQGHVNILHWNNVAIAAGRHAMASPLSWAMLFWGKLEL